MCSDIDVLASRVTYVVLEIHAYIHATLLILIGKAE
jgi:hypothetical protein